MLCTRPTRVRVQPDQITDNIEAKQYHGTHHLHTECENPTKSETMPLLRSTPVGKLKVFLYQRRSLQRFGHCWPTMELSRAQSVGENAESGEGALASHPVSICVLQLRAFRSSEPVYMTTFLWSWRITTWRVLYHVETGCDLEPASEAVIQLHSEQQ